MNRMRDKWLRAGLALLLLAGAGNTVWAGRAQVNIVATVPNLGSIATEVGGERINVTTIASGTQDAHFVDPKPSYIIKLRKADLLLVNGLDLEIGWVPPLTQGARTGRLVYGGEGYIDCSSGMPVIEIPLTLSRAEGDVHPYGNPHYLTDPLNAEIAAGTIAAALTKVDPDGAEVYEENRQSFVQRLHDKLFGKELVDLVGGGKLAREARAGTLDAFLDGTSLGGAKLRDHAGGWLAAMRPFHEMPLVTYHKDLSYFANRFGIKVIEYVEPKPGIQPSAKHLDELVKLFEAGEARIIVTRPFVEHRSTDYLAKTTGVKIITLPIEVGGAREATDYFKLYDFVINQLVEAFHATAAGTGG